jgi:hypothetical protein
MTRPSRAVKWVSTYPTYHESWLQCMPRRQESCGTLSSSSHTLTVTQVTSMRHIFYFRDANLFSSSMDITSVPVFQPVKCYMFAHETCYVPILIFQTMNKSSTKRKYFCSSWHLCCHCNCARAVTPEIQKKLALQIQLHCAVNKECLSCFF